MSIYRPTIEAIEAKRDELMAARIAKRDPSDIQAAIGDIPPHVFQMMWKALDDGDAFYVAAILKDAIRLHFDAEMAVEACEWADAEEEKERARYQGEAA